MIVDDEEDLTWSLDNALKADYNILTANDGTSAFKIIRDKNIDVVISNINMPGINGLNLLGIITKLFPGLKVIIMSAYASDYVEQKAYQLGCFKFFHKPFLIDELKQAIKEALYFHES
jgi:DNA-binding NtrC family response regulator